MSYITWSFHISQDQNEPDFQGKYRIRYINIKDGNTGDGSPSFPSKEKE